MTSQSTRTMDLGTCPTSIFAVRWLGSEDNQPKQHTYAGAAS